ncbi:hypothetical protein FOA52_003410 [Chlamydomonas sp. UWO 241]|nr:hypothetical protein FOA52_003410 [Chlamydomonas sp. UWO 241]
MGHGVVLGRALVAQHAAGQLGQELEAGLSLSFISVGQVLRDEVLLDAYTRLASTANLMALQNRAHSLMEDACNKLQVAGNKAKTGSSSVLVCECVEELADAHTLLACLEDHNVPLLQALWASAWLHEHSRVQQFEPRWIYLFEAVYRENTVVVQYPFVLLGAVSPEGVELTDAAAMQQLARRLGVMVVPSLSVPHDELLQRLSRGCCGDAPTSAGCQQRPASEGWVIMMAEGERRKLVEETYKCASLTAKALHPLAVWDAVLCGASSRQLLDRLPAHLCEDACAVLDALSGSYDAVLQQLQQQLRRAQEQGLAQRCRELAATSEEAGGRGSSSSSLVELQSLMAGPSLAAQGDLGLNTMQEMGSSSTTGSSSSSSTTAAFQAALRYVLLQGSCRAPSMHLDVRSLGTDAFWDDSSDDSSDDSWEGGGAAPLLRGLVMQCIRPAVDGSLPGYLPCPNVRQTSAKGWVAGPQVGRLALAQRENPLEVLPDVVLSHTLWMLELVSWY